MDYLSFIFFYKNNKFIKKNKVWAGGEEMFNKMKDLGIYQQIEYLTRHLISMESCSEKGEINKADWLIDFMKSFPYFQKNPQFLSSPIIEKDEYKRKNVFAFVKAPFPTKKTIIYFAHFDTVGTEDFGAIQSIAHHPDKLAEYFSNYLHDQEVMEDARSGDWLFGRGSLDMQSGVAVHLSNLLYFTEHLEELNGNLLVMFNPDEESQHAGSRGALEHLIQFKQEHSLEFVAAINNDVVSPLYYSDSNKYIYTGTAGKLLPCFAIFGREAHVGESLSAIDPTIIASEINVRINQNVDLVEQIDGELVLPPSCLYLRDDKKQYDVQTAISSRLYFNYFFYEKSPTQIMENLIGIAKDACIAFEARQSENYKKFIKMNQLPKRDLGWFIEVTTLENYIEYLSNKGILVDSEINRVLEEYKQTGVDDRDLAFNIVEALHQLDPEKKPRVIIFYAPPFLPSNYLDLGNERGMKIAGIIKNILEEEELESGESFKLRKYFPYLSDGSFLSFNGSKEDIHSLKRNFPAMDELFTMPLEMMKELSIPAINVGVYGKGAHKWTERVFMPYSFGVLPKLIRRITNALLTDY